MKVVKVKDLKDQVGNPSRHALLHCAVCGGEYSANRGDYFMADAEHIFRCHGRPMRLVTKHAVYAEVN